MHYLKKNHIRCSSSNKDADKCDDDVDGDDNDDVDNDDDVDDDDNDDVDNDDGVDGDDNDVDNDDDERNVVCLRFQSPPVHFY